ncbi:hypothetical protein GCT13_33020 [Paraburkholderia sp. CNPSo 3157]|uniref:Uncharacterized protein n=1 Tax=Paraburkholderia franconis TaxID=2654983 RepID=A0A7X1NGL5_9BURK|nr:hypothetical protein [Paraburkholderia franconis]MPW21565.1 hypothetical protein [Paraburkholderia franconis]
MRRIDDGRIQRSTIAGFAVMQQQSADSADDEFRDLVHVRALILAEIDLYGLGIATAESGGFFETRLICEGILSQKSSMVA